MSHTDDTQPNRGRPVLMRVDDDDESRFEIWGFCGEFEGSKETCADLARNKYGPGIYKVFPSGSWPGGYLRD